MKVGHVNFAKGYRGGERQTELLIKALADKGVRQVAMFRHDSPLHERLADVQLLELIKCRKPYAFQLLSNVDLVHAHEAKAAQWAYLNYRAKGVPYLITRRVMKVPKKSSFTRRVYQSAETVVCLSQAIKDSVLSRFPELVPHIIGDMLAHLPTSREGRAALCVPETGTSLVVGQVGALSMKDKAQQLSINAFRKLSKDEFTLLLLGEGKDREKLEQLADGMPNVHFLGFQDNIGDWLRQLDVFLFPSLSEGFGSSILDAMDAGVAVIASSTGGIPEVVDDGETGLLVPSGDAGKIAEALLVLAQDPGLREQLAKNAKRELERFSPECIANQYLSKYRSIFE